MQIIATAGKGKYNLVWCEWKSEKHIEVMHIPEFKSNMTFKQIARIFSIIAINVEKELLREH